jgi:hypothetical protein
MKWFVGIAVDTHGGKFYWTQKGGHHAGLGRIFRGNFHAQFLEGWTGAIPSGYSVIRSERRGR